MKTPSTPDLVELLRNADEKDIRQRLDELEGEREALRSLLRSIQARNRTRPSIKARDQGGEPCQE